MDLLESSLLDQSNGVLGVGVDSFDPSEVGNYGEVENALVVVENYPDAAGSYLDVVGLFAAGGLRAGDERGS